MSFHCYLDCCNKWKLPFTLAYEISNHMGTDVFRLQCLKKLLLLQCAQSDVIAESAAMAFVVVYSWSFLYLKYDNETCCSKLRHDANIIHWDAIFTNAVCRNTFVIFSKLLAWRFLQILMQTKIKLRSRIVGEKIGPMQWIYVFSFHTAEKLGF